MRYIKNICHSTEIEKKITSDPGGTGGRSRAPTLSNPVVRGILAAWALTDTFARAAAQPALAPQALSPTTSALPVLNPPNPPQVLVPSGGGQDLLPLGPNGQPIVANPTFVPALDTVDGSNLAQHDAIPLTASTGSLSNDGYQELPCIVCPAGGEVDNPPQDVADYQTYPTVPGSAAFNYLVEDSTSTLFGSSGLPSATDEATGNYIGDIGLGAAMRAFAQTDPGTLKNLFTAVGHRGATSYLTIDFCDTKGNKQPVKTDSALPYDAQNRPLLNLAALDPVSGHRIIWPSLVEKAAAIAAGGYENIVGANPVPWMAMLTCNPQADVTAFNPFSISNVQQLASQITTMFTGVRKMAVFTTIQASQIGQRGGLFDGESTTFFDGSVLRLINDGSTPYFTYLSSLGSQYALLPNFAYTLAPSTGLKLNGLAIPTWELGSAWNFNLNVDGLDGETLPANLYVPTDLLYAAGAAINLVETTT